MAEKKTERPPAVLTIPRSSAAKKLAERIEKGRALLEIEVQNWAQLESTESEYSKWHQYNTELLRRIFSDGTLADEYSWWGIAGARSRDAAERLRELHKEITDHIRRIESILYRLDLIPEPAGTSSKPEASSHVASQGNRVFIVHGHDEGAKESVARYVSQLELTPIILHEDANRGRTIFHKFKDNAEVSFAIVLLTADDVGAPKSTPDNLRPRPRQNVVFELGYFIGKLGPERVCALRDESSDLEILSDYHGVSFIPRDGLGAWRLSLAKELKAAGFPIDLNKCV